MNQTVNRILAVFHKDLSSELRSRYSISSISLFILTTIAMVLFGTAGEKFEPGIASGIIWIIIFFGSMTGLSRSFISEEERGTYFFLKNISTPASVYFGKLLFNIATGLYLGTLALILFLFFFESLRFNYFTEFVISYYIGIIAISSASNIISAIIAKANSKGALFPALAFPVLIPVIMPGVDAVKLAIEGVDHDVIIEHIFFMLGYTGLLITLSYYLFDIIWKE